MTRPHVLMLATTVPVEPGDGTPSFVLDLASSLTTSFDVTILAPRVPGSYPRHEINGVTVLRFPYFLRRWEGLASDAIMPTLRSEPWRWIEVVPLIASMTLGSLREVRRSKVAVINAHWIIPAGLVALAVNRLFRTPFVVTAHGADAYTLRNAVTTRAKRAVLTRSSAVLPVSSEIAQRLSAVGGSDLELSKPIPMGVPPVESTGLERSPATFLFVGRLAEKKGVHVAVEALALTDAGTLRVVGDGPDASDLERLAARLGVANRVRFLGRQSRAVVIREMQRCTALVIPSVEARDGDRDGTPVVLAEAMSCGAPVIASRIAGIADYISDGETGHLVPPGDADALAQTLKQVMGSPATAFAIGVQARAQFDGGPLDIASTAHAYATTLRAVIQ